MSYVEITDPLFSKAVHAIDQGDEQTLRSLLETHPHLVNERLPSPNDGYFKEPYLLWFVAENPVRNDRLPKNIANITRLIIDCARQSGVSSLQHQVNYTLELVCSGRVSREHNVQPELIDALVENGANPDEAMSAALHHQEVEALRRLVHHKAKMTLPIAIALKEKDEIKTLISNSSREELQVALTAAAFYGDVDVLKLLLPHQLDVNAWNRDGFHSHSTPLHQAVLSGSVDSVRALVNAGADIRIKDKEYNGSALSWAIYCQQPAVEQFLREHLAQEIVMKLVDQRIIDQSDVSKAIHQIASEIVS
jgi:ankyrin repeat protein